ncbi:MAG: hypothetical protein Q9160_002115 [Pyrenula sp. 1 TL-2023]
MNSLNHNDLAAEWVARFPAAAPRSNLISSAAKFAQEYMSQPQFDSSHNFTHIRRVVALAGEILEGEITAVQGSLGRKCDPTLVFVGALLHDVADHKYLPDSGGKDPLKEVLESLDAGPDFAHKLHTLVQNVSYSFEIKQPSRIVQQTLEFVPELAIVQDADRLDALGAVGVGRCFSFNAARRYSMENAVEHFSEKLVKLEALMKTRTGRNLARVRSARLKEFLGWWNDETSNTTG